MLDVARKARALLDRLSKMEVLGVPIDWLFHMVGAAIIVFLLSRVLGRRQTLILTITLLVAKEVVDVFVKSRIEYIRPPGIDLAFDMTAGLIGIGLGYLLVKRFPSTRSRRS